MGKHTSTAAYGIRLPHEVWDAINTEADSLGMSRNEFILRKLTAALRAPRERRNPANFARKDEDDLVELPDE